MCLDNLKDLQIESSFEDIEKMSCTQFKNILKEECEEGSFLDTQLKNNELKG